MNYDEKNDSPKFVTWIKYIGNWKCSSTNRSGAKIPNDSIFCTISCCPASLESRRISGIIATETATQISTTAIAIQIDFFENFQERFFFFTEITSIYFLSQERISRFCLL